MPLRSQVIPWAGRWASAAKCSPRRTVASRGGHKTPAPTSISRTSSSPTVATDVSLYCVRFVNASVGWVVGGSGTILKTTNGGVNWVRQTSGMPNTILRAVDFVDVQRGYIVGDDGVVLRTLNGGTTWTQVDAGTDRSLFDLFVLDADLVWVVGQNGTIRKLN
jgi:photosystem II stability/assembly factor-like uncharacterized protein